MRSARKLVTLDVRTAEAVERFRVRNGLGSYSTALAVLIRTGLGADSVGIVLSERVRPEEDGNG